MKQGIVVVCAMVFLLSVPTGRAQQTQPSDSINLANGFTMRPTGGIDVGELYAEVVEFGTDWKETEEHDVFNPDVTTPDTNTHVATGDFKTPGGTFTLTEHITAIDGGISFTADVKSDTEIQANELSLGIQLPVTAVGGKQITIDGEAVTMPMEPAKKGAAQFFDKEDAHEIDIPTPTGTLTVTGKFTMIVQDDREWGDNRYAVRMQFTPGTGAIKESKIDVQMKWAPKAK